MKKKRIGRWFKFVGYKVYCLPMVTDYHSLAEAANELPYPRDVWWLDWIHDNGGWCPLWFDSLEEVQ